MNNDQTGEYSVYSEYKDRQIMFHVSTLLPLDASDSQHVRFIYYYYTVEPLSSGHFGTSYSVHYREVSSLRKLYTCINTI